MPVETGIEYIRKHSKEIYEKDMIDKIDMFSAHGIDVMKIEMYRKFINDMKKERFDEMEKKIIKNKKLTNESFKIDPSIEKEIMKMRMDAKRK